MSRTRTWIRIGLAVLTAYHLGLGAWLLLAARSFYDGVPTVDLFPPFNAHLFNDFGAANVSIAIVLGAAAVLMERRLVLVALVADVVFAALHLAFHASHLGGFTVAEAIEELGGLAVLLALPASLALTAWLHRDNTVV